MRCKKSHILRSWFHFIDDKKVEQKPHARITYEIFRWRETRHHLLIQKIKDSFNNKCLSCKVKLILSTKCKMILKTIEMVSRCFCFVLDIQHQCSTDMLASSLCAKWQKAMISVDFAYFYALTFPGRISLWFLPGFDSHPFFAFSSINTTEKSVYPM